MKQLTSRQKQAIATKMRITEKAMSLFKLHGIDGVKISDICESANVSVGAFYHYFESKDKILENAYGQIDFLVEESVEVKSYDNNYDKILQIFHQAIELIENLGWKFMSDTFRYIITAPSQFTLSLTRYPYAAIKKTIDDGILSGEFKKDLDSSRITHIFMGIGRGLIFDWCLYEGSYSIQDETKHIIKIVLDSYLA